MSNPTTDALQQATAAQLRAEIAASNYRSARAIALELGMNYTSLTRNLAGENPIKLSTLFKILALIELSPGEFFSRVDSRVPRD